MSEKRPEDLSVNELRRLLLNKRRVSRKDRLERFRRTGRVVALSPDLPADAAEALRLGRVVDTLVEGAAPGMQDRPAGAAQSPKDSRRVLMDRILLGVE